VVTQLTVTDLGLFKSAYGNALKCSGIKLKNFPWKAQTLFLSTPSASCLPLKILGSATACL